MSFAIIKNQYFHPEKYNFKKNGQRSHQTYETHIKPKL